MSPSGTGRKLPKSQDRENWRKGAELRQGDRVAVRWDGKTPVEFSEVVSVERVDAATLGQRGGRQHRVRLANGDSKAFASGEFAEGNYR